MDAGGRTGSEADRGEGGVRTALAGLTTRGRSLPGRRASRPRSARTSWGKSDLLRVGLLLGALPAGLRGRALPHAVPGRGQIAKLSPGGCPRAARPGPSARGQRLPAAHRSADAPGPGALRARSAPRFVLDQVEPAAVAARCPTGSAPTCAADYPLGPLQLRLTDPFGLCRADPGPRPRDALTVIPRVEAAAAGAAERRGEGVRRGPTRARSPWPATTT